MRPRMQSPFETLDGRQRYVHIARPSLAERTTANYDINNEAPQQVDTEANAGADAESVSPS